MSSNPLNLSKEEMKNKKEPKWRSIALQLQQDLHGHNYVSRVSFILLQNSSESKF